MLFREIIKGAKTKVVDNISHTRNTVNWLLFVMYQFSPVSLVSAMMNLRIDEYKYHWPDCIACERKYLSLYSLD